MGFFKKIFGGGQSSGTPLHKQFMVKVEDETMPAVYVDKDDDPLKALDALGLQKRPRPAIFITGGAGNMSEKDKELTRELFEQAIAPFAQKYNITVIDGATKSGVIEMMAMARKKGNFTFPLIGIAPHSKVLYPGHTNTEGNELCPGHSHFVFVTGDEYGAESEMIIWMSHMLAGGKRDNSIRTLPALGIVINGGQITRQEAYMASTKELSIPLVVMEGSGRFADELSSAVRTGETSQALLRSIIQRGDIQLVATTAGKDAMMDKLTYAFKSQSR